MPKRRGAASRERQQQQRRETLHHHRSIFPFFSSFARGLRQACRLDLALASVSRSESARTAASQCFRFNGIIFLSLLAWRWAVAPAAAAAVATTAQRTTSFPPLLSALTSALFAQQQQPSSSPSPPLQLYAAFVLGWIFPASALALSLSGGGCLAVAKGVFGNEEGGEGEEGKEKARRGRSGGGRSRSRGRSRSTTRKVSSPSPPPPKTTRRKVTAHSSAAAAEDEALELQRGTLFSFLWAQAGLSRLLPPSSGFFAFAGPLLSTLLTWLLYGLMAFDYRFTAQSESGVEARREQGRQRRSSKTTEKKSDEEEEEEEEETENSENGNGNVIGIAERVTAFGKHWPFYLAFGIVAASPSVVLPFWEGKLFFSCFEF